MIPEWSALFCEPAADAPQVAFRLVRRKGAPLLLLPSSAAAAKCVELYPAQTPAARAARFILQCGLRLSLPLVRERFTLPLPADAPLTRLLAEASGGAAPPLFGALLGNPNALGRRFIFLVFDSAHRPRAVVKAGAGPEAERLISREVEVLQQLPAACAAPSLLGGFRKWEGGAAQALRFVPGRSPRSRADRAAATRVLRRWIHAGESVPLVSLDAWQRLRRCLARDPRWVSVETQTRNRVVNPVIVHGDFAPWNLRVHRGEMTAIDWERGELRGVPGWDWFHFLIQEAILVQRCDAREVRARLEALIASPAWADYAKRAQIRGIERPLVAAYLAHAVEIVGQTEGRKQMAELRAEWQVE